MTMIQLFFNPKEKKYYCKKDKSVQSLNCSICHHNLKNDAFLIIGYHKKDSKINFLCENHQDETPLDFSVCYIKEKWHIKISGKIPPKSIPIKSHKIHLVDKFNSISVFDAVFNKCPSIDRTVLAGKDSFEGAKIGLPIQEVIEPVDRFIQLEKHLNLYLEDLQKAEPLIENKSLPKLQYKKTSNQ